MIYLIYNEYFNRGIKTVELRNEYHDTLSFRTDVDEYQIGDYVCIEKINNKEVISHKVAMPSNFLKFYKHGNLTTSQLESEIISYVSMINSENIKMILDETIFKYNEYFLYPAAKAIHHAHIGGLATHSLNMLKLAEVYINLYDLNYDIIIAGCLLHDFGKIYELTDYGLNYSLEGNLLGHIAICYEMVSNVARDLNINQEKEIIALKHIILSHHGKLEYGSPKEPMTLESYVISQLDEVDAKVDLLKGVLKDATFDKLTPPVMAMDRRRFIKISEE